LNVNPEGQVKQAVEELQVAQVELQGAQVFPFK